MTDTLTPAAELASRSTARWPNESAAYRAARTLLLAEEIQLRRHIQQVAEQRRALPPGGEVAQDYAFMGKDGPVTLRGLFGRHDTLVVYSMMYGPMRKQVCPMCAALLETWDGMARHVAKCASLVIVARSSIDRVLDCAAERGWTGLTFLSDPSGDFTADYVGDRDADMPAYTIFRRAGGQVRHFYSGEGGMEIADPGQDPHAAPDLNPLWVLLDTTPEGRGTDWYPDWTTDPAQPLQQEFPMSYVSGFVVPVPTDLKGGVMFRDYGALEMMEAWGENIRDGKQIDFRRAVQAKDGETVVFSWIVWPDRATADVAERKMMDDDRMTPPMDAPFDMKRMIFGGFAPIFQMGRTGADQ